jgi:hypothetical protein
MHMPHKRKRWLYHYTFASCAISGNYCNNARKFETSRNDINGAISILFATVQIPELDPQQDQESDERGPSIQHHASPNNHLQSPLKNRITLHSVKN